jgi:hypothetical protein
MRYYFDGLFLNGENKAKDALGLKASTVACSHIGEMSAKEAKALASRLAKANNQEIRVYTGLTSVRRLLIIEVP